MSVLRIVSRRRFALVVALLLGIVALVASLTVPRPAASAVLQTYSLWPVSSTPAVAAAHDAHKVELGTRFTTSRRAQVTAIRFYKARTNTGRHIVTLWGPHRAKLARQVSTSEGRRGWQTVRLHHAVTIRPGTTYLVSYDAPHGHYSYAHQRFGHGRVVRAGPLKATQGLYRLGHGYPTRTYRHSAYYVGVVVQASAPPPPANQNQIGVIGDSLTEYMDEYDDIESPLVSMGWQHADIRIDGLAGRGIDTPAKGTTDTASPYTSDVITAWRKAGFDPRVWVIALGTNNPDDPKSYWRDSIQGVIDQIKSGPAKDYTIYWIGTGYEDASAFNQAAFNKVLKGVISTNKDVVFGNYNHHLAPFRSDSNWQSWWEGSGIHNTESGYKTLREPFYLNLVKPETP